MTALTEGRHAAEFLMDEEPYRTREIGTLASGQTVRAGEVLMKNGSQKLVVYDGATDSVAVGLAIYPATVSADTKIAYVAREAVVNGNLIYYPTGDLTATSADLAALQILIR